MNHNRTVLQLIEPIPRENRKDHLYSLRQFLASTTKDLDARFEILEVDNTGRVTLEIQGEDCTVFSSILESTFGIVPRDSDDLTGRIFKGFVAKIDSEREELLIDIDTKRRCVLGSASLVSIFGKGKFEKLTQLLGLNISMPLEVSVTIATEDTAHLSLSNSQIDRYRNWTRDFLNRIIVLDCTRKQAKNALAATENLRNIVDIERLGFYCQLIICKFGVDKEEITAELARFHKHCRISLFSPIDIIVSLDLPSKKLLSRLKAF